MIHQKTLTHNSQYRNCNPLSNTQGYRHDSKVKSVITNRVSQWVLHPFDLMSTNNDVSSMCTQLKDVQFLTEINIFQKRAVHTCGVTHSGYLAFEELNSGKIYIRGNEHSGYRFRVTRDDKTILQLRRNGLYQPEDKSYFFIEFNNYFFRKSGSKSKHKETSLPSKETLRGHSDSSFRGEGYIQCCVGVRLCGMYSNQELAEIHFMYGKADGNAALARRLYQERYPQRQCPDRKTLIYPARRLLRHKRFKIRVDLVVTLHDIVIIFGWKYFEKQDNKVVVITVDVQNVHLLLEYRPHIDVSLACEHDPKLQEYPIAYVLRTCHNSIPKGFQIRHRRRINQ
ncbi:hypothetical protein ANN_26996 [Periplaneta americana]|uniref:DUF4817 domain-containing protein n=1 Tax=Periplaneta americana TaxID=6978 RepID=A0ABQ8RX11_PERAM|nr:hypothetical protein ANN_26996 [Periplaneta americana]